MSEVPGAEKGERTEGRQGYRSGYYRRSLVARVGKIELRVPHYRVRPGGLWKQKNVGALTIFLKKVLQPTARNAKSL